MIILACTKCENPVERTIPTANPVCYPCKKKRGAESQKERWRKMKEKRMSTLNINQNNGSTKV